MTEDRLRLEAELAKVSQAITAQEALRGILPDEQIDATLLALAEKKSALEAQIYGSGSIAQGKNATAATATTGGTAIGRVEGDVYFGQPPPDSTAARRLYLTRLRQQCEALPLAALGGDEGLDEELTLDRIYIDLDTTTLVTANDSKKRQRPQQREAVMPGQAPDQIPLTALEAAKTHSRLALLGDPGAGKSTFARKLLVWQAAANLGESEPPPGCSADLLPILVTLRELAPSLAELKLASLSEERQRETLAQAVKAHIVADLSRLEAEALAADLQAILTGGHCLLVLDGLDEVPQELRLLVRRAVTAVVKLYRPKRILLTCRIRSYEGQTVFPSFKAYTLAPFSREKIEGFVRAWYYAHKELGRFDAEEAQAKAADLTQAALAVDLRELAENPMILTTMALIHQREISLPPERVRLYKLAVEVLLHRWQKRKTGEARLAPSPQLRQLLKDDRQLRRVMERLAYEAHLSGASHKEAADLPRGQALILLEESQYLDNYGLAAEFLDYVDQRAGILVGRGGDLKRPTVYSFPHRTFQEYLAGCYMVGQRGAARLLFQKADEGDTWAVAAKLGAEELFYNGGPQGLNNLLDLTYSLYPTAACTTTQTQRAVLWAGTLATITGREPIIRDTNAPNGGQNFLEALLAQQVSLLNSDLPAIERAEAGVTLAKLGDPRSGVRLRSDGLPDIVWGEIPSGPFLMGSLNDDLNSWAKHNIKETPQFESTLAAFKISRYPITNAQFHSFVERGGYQEARYWPVAVEAGYWQTGQVKREVYSSDGGWQVEWADSPYNYGHPFNLPNHPVVGINWFEAVAFCVWLTEQLQQTGTLNPHQAITLPSESQWEKAARGTDGRAYPWGEPADAERANYDETALGTTSAVGCFPQGASPYGVEDMSGNVWEWGRTKWQNSYEGYQDDNDLRGDVPRVLRGGAFSNSGSVVRCAARLRDFPNNGYNSLGFRVVVSPFNSDL